MGTGHKIRDFLGCAVALGDSPASQAAILWRETKNLRVRYGLGRHHPDRTYALRTRFGRLHFRDNFGDITNLTNLLYRRIYELPHAPAHGAVLDVGANIGMAAVWFRSLLPGRPIHCFEPLIENTRLIEMNVPDAVINRVAVGAEAGVVRLAVDADAVMASSVPWRQVAEQRTIPVISLDEYTRTHAIERVAVLKIDAEGMEIDVLRGAVQTLGRTDQVVLETHGLDRHRHVMEVLAAAEFSIRREEFVDTTGMVYAARERVSAAVTPRS